MRQQPQGANRRVSATLAQQPAAEQRAEQALPGDEHERRLDEGLLAASRSAKAPRWPGHGVGGVRSAGGGVRAARGPLEPRGLGVCRAGLRGAVAREAAQRLGPATYSARKWLAARRPVYRWKRLGAGYKASAAGAGGCSSGPLDSGMAAFFSRSLGGIGPEN